MSAENYKTFKALGLMMCYPAQEWISELPQLCALIEDEQLLRTEDAQGVRSFAENLQGQSLLDVQENYVATFDRVRSLSLHLFEHVHGESRDRGQAMVDLKKVYEDQGFELDGNELPDYLPAFLEFLSVLPKDEAIEMLQEPAHLLVALGKRLAERGSPYASLFNSLIHLSGLEPLEIKRVLPVREPSFEQIDKEWQEKPIDFLGAADPQSGCGTGQVDCASTPCGTSTACGTPSNAPLNPIQNAHLSGARQ